MNIMQRIHKLLRAIPLFSCIYSLAKLCPELFGSPWKLQHGFVWLGERRPNGSKVMYEYDAWQYKPLFGGKRYRKFNYPRAA